MNVVRGDVVLVKFLFSDGSGRSKLRPAVIVQTDELNGRITDSIIAAISTKSHRASTYQVLIDISTPEGLLSGLRFSSMAQCENLLTIDRDLFQAVIGHLPEVIMQQINTSLKEVLALS
ncbi:MAG: type II toxin-antitoxin system PemK/MazF family toxin [Gemmatales bacterium]